MGTGALVALADTGDALQSVAEEFYRDLPRTVRRVASQLVVAQTFTLRRYQTNAGIALGHLHRVSPR